MHVLRVLIIMLVPPWQTQAAHSFAVPQRTTTEPLIFDVHLELSVLRWSTALAFAGNSSQCAGSSAKRLCGASLRAARPHLRTFSQQLPQAKQQRQPTSRVHVRWHK